METRVDRTVRLARGAEHPLPSPRRAGAAQLAREVELVGRSGVVAALLQAVDATLLVLNAQRQVVAVNAPDGRAGDLVGLRPGEALGCANARDGECGASPACRLCGALGAILCAQGSGRTAEAECLLTGATAGDARELAVRTTPVVVDGAPFTVVSLRDISVEKRCERLEQLFVHDVLNTVTGLRGWAWRLARPGADAAVAAAQIDQLSRRLEREIRDHRALLLAERGELEPARERVRARELLGAIDVDHFGLDAAQGRRLELADGGGELELETDPALLTRVLVNMIKNALEATAPDGVVRVGCEASRLGPQGAAVPAVRLWVHNGGAIPPAVQLRIFQRSFSTKAARGRGLGTYGMKLLGERHLGGRVAFASSAEAGTTFEIRLPAA
jgi:hypothetical protein